MNPRDWQNLLPHAAPAQGGAYGAGAYGTEGAARPGRTKQIERALDLLYRRRWTVAGVFGAVLALAVGYATVKAPTYQASAIVMVDLAKVPGGQSVVPQEGSPYVRSSDRTITTELFIIENSPAIAERVAQRMEAAEAAGHRPRGSVQFGPASRYVNSALQITATSTDSSDAALLANAYAEEYIRQTQDASRSYLGSSREYLEEQQATRRAELTAAEEALESYMRAAGTAGPTASDGSVVSRIASMEASRDEAGIDLQMRQANLASVERELAAINPRLAQRLSSSVERRMQALEREMAQLEGQKAEIVAFEQMQGGDLARRQAELDVIDRQVQSRQAEMDRLSEQFVQEVMAAGGTSSNQGVSYAAELQRRAIQERIEIEGLGARIGTMEARLGEYQGELAQIPEESTDLARLQRTRAHAEQMYNFIVERLEQTRVSEGLEPGYARVLQRARAPKEPAGLTLPRLLILSFFFGLPLALGVAIARDRFDNRIYKPDQVRERGLGVLGVIPNLKPLLREAHKKRRTAERDGVEVAVDLVTLLTPVSAPSEAYRHVRTAIQFSRPGIVVQSVLVTSAGPGEGKSTTAANLAVAMAQARRRTLLIDADLRRPHQHALFGLGREPGLAQLLLGEDGGGDDLRQTLEGALRPYQSPHDEHLVVLPAGGILGDPGAGRRGAAAEAATVIENPSELLGSKRMRDLLDAARGLFDVIIIDTPPVLAATDAVLLSTQADATVLVVGAGKTKEGDLDHTLGMLGDVGARVVGALLNGFDLSMAYGYTYSYGHYSKYGPYSKHGYVYGGEQEKKVWWQRGRRPKAARQRVVSAE